jgi:hypothetical protein
MEVLTSKPIQAASRILLFMRDRVSASTRLAWRLKCSSLKLGHRNRDLWLQLTNPTAQLANSALPAHTAIRARLNHRQAFGPRSSTAEPFGPRSTTAIRATINHRQTLQCP